MTQQKDRQEILLSMLDSNIPLKLLNPKVINEILDNNVYLDDEYRLHMELTDVHDESINETITIENEDQIKSYLKAVLMKYLFQNTHDQFVDSVILSVSHQNIKDEIEAQSFIEKTEARNYEEYELQQIARDFLDKEREQSDKLWLYLSYGLGLFIIGYMVYHICLALLTN
jgi:hypothetical protein